MEALLLLTLLFAAPAPDRGVTTPEQLARAEKLLIEGDYAASLAEARRALKAEPRSALAHFIIGACKLRLGDDAGARKDLQRAASLEPGFHRPGLHYQLGRFAMLEAASAAPRSKPKILGEALGHFEQELGFLPGHEGSLSGKVIVLDRLGRPAEALETTRAWRRADPGSVEANSMLIRRLAVAGLIDEVMQAIENFPEDHRERLPPAVLGAVLGLERDEAIPLIRRSLELQPGDRAAFGLHAAMANDSNLPDYLALGPLLAESLLVGKLWLYMHQLAAVRTGVMHPVLEHKVRPTYPELARMAHMDGRVVVLAIIGADGVVQATTVLSTTNRIFEEPSLDAVRQWKYRPATRDGKPVPVYFTILVDFALTNR